MEALGYATQLADLAGTALSECKNPRETEHAMRTFRTALQPILDATDELDDQEDLAWHFGMFARIPFAIENPPEHITTLAQQTQIMGILYRIGMTMASLDTLLRCCTIDTDAHCIINDRIAARPMTLREDFPRNATTSPIVHAGEQTRKLLDKMGMITYLPLTQNDYERSFEHGWVLHNRDQPQPQQPVAFYIGQREDHDGTSLRPQKETIGSRGLSLHKWAGCKELHITHMGFTGKFSLPAKAVRLAFSILQDAQVQQRAVKLALQ